MNHHLSSEEFVAALESMLPPAREAHVDRCASCHTALADLRQSVGHVHSNEEIPEPSPLFWDHLSERVRVATSAESMTPQSSWLASWRPFVAAGAAVAAMALVIVLRMPAAPPASVHEVASAPRDAAVSSLSMDDDASWNAMADLASTLSSDDVHLVVASAPETTAPINELTPAERQAFVNLLKVDMGGGQ